MALVISLMLHLHTETTALNGLIVNADVMGHGDVHQTAENGSATMSVGNARLETKGIPVDQHLHTQQSA